MRKKKLIKKAAPFVFVLLGIFLLIFVVCVDTEYIDDMPAAIYIFAIDFPVIGNIGGRIGADSLAESTYNNHYGYLECENIHAFLSFSSADKIINMPDNYGFPQDLPIKSPNETSIANNWDDLLDGNITMTLQEAGIFSSNEWYWTGSYSDGEIESADTCGGWNNDSNSNYGKVGVSWESENGWLNLGTQSCDQDYKFLAICWK